MQNKRANMRILPTTLCVIINLISFTPIFSAESDLIKDVKLDEKSKSAIAKFDAGIIKLEQKYLADTTKLRDRMIKTLKSNAKRAKDIMVAAKIKEKISQLEKLVALDLFGNPIVRLPTKAEIAKKNAERKAMLVKLNPSLGYMRFRSLSPLHKDVVNELIKSKSYNGRPNPPSSISAREVIIGKWEGMPSGASMPKRIEIIDFLAKNNHKATVGEIIENTMPLLKDVGMEQFLVVFALNGELYKRSFRSKDDLVDLLAISKGALNDSIMQAK